MRPEILNLQINLMFAGHDLDIEAELNRQWQQNEELSDYREDERRMRDEWDREHETGPYDYRND